jgi:hypothetical protein
MALLFKNSRPVDDLDIRFLNARQKTFLRNIGIMLLTLRQLFDEDINGLPIISPE